MSDLIERLHKIARHAKLFPGDIATVEEAASTLLAVEKERDGSSSATEHTSPDGLTEARRSAGWCEVCGGDCAGANPPVTYCPMREPDQATAVAALRTLVRAMSADEVASALVTEAPAAWSNVGDALAIASRVLGGARRDMLGWVGTLRADPNSLTAVLTLDWPEFDALRAVVGLRPYREANPPRRP